MSQLWRLSATRIANMIRLKQVSATEVAQDALARLAAVNPVLNAVVDQDPDQTLARAAEIDAGLAAGRPMGPLAGVPVTIKINVDQQGFATSNGLRSRANVIAPGNNPVVEGFLAAGAVPVGRTNTPAFSARYFTDNQLFGPTHNPRDRRLTPGGSSGGAASAVTAGIGCIAHGNDIGGSVRYPAYACGVHGLRPGLGRVATFNESGPDRTIGFQLMSVQGPLARTVHDVRMGFQAMCRRDMRDPWYFDAPEIVRPNPKLAAFCARPEGIETAPEVESALRDAAERLRDAGWTVVELDELPPLKEASMIMHRLWVADAPEAILAAARAEGDPGAIAAMEGSLDWVGPVSLADFGATLTRRASLLREWLAFFETYPVLLMPPSSQLPFEVDTDLNKGFRHITENQYFMAGPPALGLPVLMVSTGLVNGSVPVGVQIMAGRMREDLCLDAGEAIEARGTPPSPIDPITA